MFKSWKELVESYYENEECNFNPEDGGSDEQYGKEWTKEVAAEKLMTDIETDSDYFKTYIRISYQDLKKMSDYDKARAFYYVLGNHDYAMHTL